MQKAESGMLKLSNAIYDEVIEHCQQTYPKEACGLLAADAAGRVGQAYPMTNVEDSPIGYSMDPKEQLQVERRMRQAGQQLAGIYHSHTASEAYPSPVDVRLAISPELSYMLVSLKDRVQPQMRSFHIVEGAIVEEELLVEGKSAIR